MRLSLFPNIATSMCKLTFRGDKTEFFQGNGFPAPTGHAGSLR